MFGALIGISGTLLAVCIYCFGYAVANNDNATECEKLGAFYVNKAVYACERVPAKSERSK
jgi:hypothetical protein